MQLYFSAAISKQSIRYHDIGMIFLVQKEYDAFLFVLENTHSFLKHLKEENLSYILFKDNSGVVQKGSSSNPQEIYA